MQNDSLTLRRLRIFSAVFSQGSFNKAAHALLLTQSAVSQHVQQLEQGLGVQLFERSARGVRPTEAGQLLHTHAQRVLQAVTEAEEALSQFAALPPQSLTIGASSGLATYVLPPLLQRFQAAQPQVALSLKTASTREVVALLTEGVLDFGLVAGGMDDLDRVGIGRKNLTSFNYAVTIHPNHPWATQQSVSKAQLATAPFINRQPNSRTRRWQEAVLAKHGVTLTTSSELDSPGTIKYALLSNMGVSILPEYTVAREVARGDLIALPIESVKLSRPMMLLWQTAAPPSMAQAALHKLFDEQM